MYDGVVITKGAPKKRTCADMAGTVCGSIMASVYYHVSMITYRA